MSRPWIERYAHAVPWDTRFEPFPVGELLVRAASAHGDRTALNFLGRRYSYAALLKQAQTAARGFQLLGLGKGSRIGLFLPNTPHYPIAYYGALLTGATVVNFSPLYSAPEVIAQAQDSGTDVLVCLDLQRLWEPARQSLAAGAVQRLIVGNLAEALPAAKSFAFRLFKSKERVQVPIHPRITRWSELLDNDARPAPAAVDPARDIALIQYTGGTTGVPKGAALTHANLSLNAQQLGSVDPDQKRTASVLGALPFFHIFANTCLLNHTLMRGGTIIMLPKFEAAEALAAIRKHRLTDLAGVPAMYQAMLDHPEVAKTSFASVQQAFSGGAAMSVALKQRFEQATGARVLEGYGLTESSGVVAVNPYRGASKAGSVGQVLPGTTITLVDIEDPFRDVPPGGRGEIVVSGPQVMQGYWRKDEQAVEPLPDGRFRTGDIGQLDEDGYLFIVDRCKDMINVGGFKVFPSQLEAVLMKHPAVKEVLVIAVPDDRVGERPKPFVVLHDHAEATSKELQSYLNATVGKHEHVHELEIRPELPKTVIGKPDRKALAAEEKAKRELAAPPPSSQLEAAG
ncbi:AMP-binding protein [Sphingomonas arenae]|uniref:AMP-binding protein n=1 Tax=Sphingomonas arenae TaxID=2812555 RepID=UPI001F2E6C78|nr:AMP-binding protein [Sphingomonas arenae]